MRIYIANTGDTLRKISIQFHVGIEQLLALNPKISSDDRNIEGKPINLPVTDEHAAPSPSPSLVSTAYTDQWVPLATLEQMSETDYDVIIIGSGAGGGAALWRLCDQWGRNGKKIGVLETGDLVLPTHAQNIATMNSDRFWNEYFPNPKISIPIGKYLPDLPGAIQVFALGGRTLFWSAVSPRVHISEFEDWPLTATEIEPYYNIAERVMNVTQAYAQGSTIQNIFLKRLQESNFPEASGIPLAIDLKETQYGQIHSNAFFSSICFLGYALNRRPFDLAIKARVIRVHTENGRAIGVTAMSREKKSFFINAKTVILSTSAYETPRLLLYSGIQGRAIGHYLVNHSLLRATGLANRKEFPEIMGAYGILIPQKERHPYQIHFHNWHSQFEDIPFQEKVEVSIAAFGKVESRFENMIYLDPNRRDEYGVPLIQAQFSYSQKDKEVIGQLTKSINQMYVDLRVPLINNPPISLMPAGSDYHEAGTCRMGVDPLTSVTNRNGQVHGVSGLYIADNSVIPTIGASNPTLTSVALAIRTADHIMCVD